MNNYQHFNGAPFKHEQQPLTPISNLTSSSYHHDSPGQGHHTLPPLNHASSTTQAPSFAHQYRSTAPDPARLPQSPDPSVDHNPGNMQHLPSMQQPQMPAAEPHTSYAPLHAFSSAPSNGSYSTHNTMNSSAPNGYPPVSLPHLSSNSFGGAMDYRQQSGTGQYQYPSQQHHQLQQQQAQQAPQLPSLQAQDRRPMPVVGSQGRRGILPTTAGKAPPPGSQPDGTMRGAAAPVNRNSENKFPCNYCNKTYLHLKHLKRHHLRHTGERPYQCGLCHETFCRSDILKRHFNKCSIRRGNPTGANHLTHAQDHLKNPQQQQQQQQQQAYSNGSAMGQRPAAITTTAPNPPSSYHHQWPGSARSFDGSYSTQQMGNQNVGSTRSSRSSSVMRPESSSDDDKKRFSSTSTLPTAVGTAETSPSAAAQTFNFDRNGAAAGHQRDGPGAYYQGGNPAQMPPLASQHGENLPPVNYLRSGGFQQYHQPAHDQQHMYQSSWNNAFQPGGSDQLMYSGH